MKKPTTLRRLARLPRAIWTLTAEPTMADELAEVVHQAEDNRRAIRNNSQDMDDQRTDLQTLQDQVEALEANVEEQEYTINTLSQESPRAELQALLSQCQRYLERQ
jgi:predicted RNase H-like nuclease (RuvC/YqgF family)